MYRSILSVFLGFVLMMILLKTYQVGLWMLMPEIFPTTAELVSGEFDAIPIGINVFMLACDVCIGLFAGYFVVAMAGEARVGHAIALASVVVLMSAGSVSQSAEIEALWYVALRFIGVPVYIYLGGRFRCKQFPSKGIPAEKLS